MDIQELILSDFFHSIFIKHPEEQNMTYVEHLKHACFYSIQTFKSSVIFLVHGFFPFLFQKTGSAIIKDLNDQLSMNASVNDNVNDNVNSINTKQNDKIE
jgi:hypothetical protein